jgi:hypothetical protein
MPRSSWDSSGTGWLHGSGRIGSIGEIGWGEEYGSGVIEPASGAIVFFLGGAATRLEGAVRFFAGAFARTGVRLAAFFLGAARRALRAGRAAARALVTRFRAVFLVPAFRPVPLVVIG